MNHPASKHISPPHKLAIILITAFCLGAYFQSLSHPLMFDNTDLFNQWFKPASQSAHNLFPNLPPEHFKPLYALTNRFLFRPFSASPFYGHLFNLGLLILFCLLLYFLLCQTLPERLTALLAVLFYAVHPYQLITVNLVSANFVLLTGLFLTLSLLLLLNNRILLNGLTLTAALLFSEMAVFFCLYGVLLLYFIKRKPLNLILKQLAPHFIITLIYVLLWLAMARPHAQIFQNITTLNISWPGYFASLGQLVFWYFKNLFIPSEVVFMKSIYPTAIGNIFWSMFVYIFILLIMTAIFRFRKKTDNVLWLIWFTSGFLLLPLWSLTHPYTGFVIEPHWFFYSSIGFFVLLARCCSFWYPYLHRLTWLTLMGALLIYFFSWALYNNHFWKSAKEYSRHWLTVSPHNSIALMTLAETYTKEGLYSQALSYTHDLLKSTYQPFRVYAIRGFLWSQFNQFSQAKNDLHKAIEINPDYAEAYNTLGTVMLKEEDFLEAEKNFLRATQLKPELIQARINLADLYLMTFQNDKAVATLERVMSSDPDHAEYRSTIVKLAIRYLQKGDVEKVLEKTDWLLKKDHNGLRILSTGFFKEGYNQIATVFASIHVRSHPQDTEGYLLYGDLLAKEGRYKEAIENWQRGQRLAPNEVQFEENVRKTRRLMMDL